VSDETPNRPVVMEATPQSYGDLPHAVPGYVMEIAQDLDTMVMPRAPGVFDRQAKVKYLMFLSRFGLRTKAAAYAGVSAQTVVNARKEDPRFDEAVTEAVQIYNEELEMAALRRAVDGWEEPVYQRGDLVGTVHKYSDRLLEMMLRANNREKFGDQIRQDINVNSGVLLVPTALTQEQWEAQFGGATVVEGSAVDVSNTPGQGQLEGPGRP